jgi:hypothetical protein
MLHHRRTEFPYSYPFELYSEPLQDLWDVGQGPEKWECALLIAGHWSQKKRWWVKTIIQNVGYQHTTVNTKISRMNWFEIVNRSSWNTLKYRVCWKRSEISFKTTYIKFEFRLLNHQIISRIEHLRDKTVLCEWIV